MRRSLAFVLVVIAAGGCKKKLPAPPRARDAGTAAAAVAIGPAEPLPGGAPDGAIGGAGPMRFVGAAADGSWVMMCQGVDPEQLRVVVGDGQGVLADRVVAATAHDLVVVDGEALVHIDVVARTARHLGPAAAVALDGESRRLVQADGTKVIIRDPGTAPRTIETGTPIAALGLRGKRWLEVAPGKPDYDLLHGDCGWVRDALYAADERTTIDLDPSGLEAPERIGPQLGITAAGEVTLDGVKVVDADCVGDVIAALADPPRALVMCNGGNNHVVGPGLDRAVDGNVGRHEQAVIADPLLLGQRMVCVNGACIDLVTGRDFATWSAPEVWFDDRYLVREVGGGVVIDDVAQERSRSLALPRLTQAVTVDTATGRRQAGAAPRPPAYIAAAGNFLLYGRHLIDVDAAALVATLPDDALAVDRSGRVLLPAAEGQGPLRWKRP